MSTKHWIGWALIAWGGIGMVNQYMLIQAAGSGQAATASLSSMDPVNVLPMIASPTPGYTSPGMLADAGIASLGAWLVFGG